MTTSRVVYAQHRVTGLPLTGATLVTSACDSRGELRGGPAWVELGGGRYKLTTRGGDEQNCTIALIDFGADALERYTVEVFHRNDNVNQCWAKVITDPTGALWPTDGDPPEVLSYGWADGTDRFADKPETFHLSELGPVWRWKPTRQDSERGASIVVDLPTGSAGTQFFERARPVLAVQTNIATALFEALSADDGVTALVETRIYPDELPQNEPVPAVTYTVVFDPKSSTFTGATLRSARVQIDVYAPTVKAAGAVQLEIERVIGAMRTPSPGLSAVQETARSFFDTATRYHRVEMEFTIWR